MRYIRILWWWRYQVNQSVFLRVYRFNSEMTQTMRSVNAENKEFTDVPTKTAEAYFHHLEGESDAKELNYGQLPRGSAEAGRRKEP